MPAAGSGTLACCLTEVPDVWGWVPGAPWHDRDQTVWRTHMYTTGGATLVPYAWPPPGGGGGHLAATAPTVGEGADETGWTGPLDWILPSLSLALYG